MKEPGGLSKRSLSEKTVLPKMEKKTKLEKKS